MCDFHWAILIIYSFEKFYQNHEVLQIYLSLLVFLDNNWVWTSGNWKQLPDSRIHFFRSRFFKSSSILFMVRFTTSFIMLSLMRTSLTECLWDMKEWYISNLRVRERYCRQFDGKKPHWFIFLMNPLILRIFPRFYSFYFFTSLFGNEYREVFREKIIIFHCLFYDINDKLVGEEPLKEFDTMKFISVNYLPLLIPNMENLTYWNSWRVSQYNY